jgi:hypothetical protein
MTTAPGRSRRRAVTSPPGTAPVTARVLPAPPAPAALPGPHPAWRRAPALALAPAIALALALAACSSPGTSPAAATKKTCQQVGAVLADGPDPDADPAGYAEAQILPLHQIRTSDARLRTAIGQLDTAYRQLFASNGASSAAAQAVAAATKKISRICPGVAS